MGSWLVDLALLADVALLCSGSSAGLLPQIVHSSFCHDRRVFRRIVTAALVSRGFRVEIMLVENGPSSRS